MKSETDRPKVLIEQWLPIAEIGAECMRERGASSALPPLYFLHVWWARRPLTASRAAILASLLPAYPTEHDDDIRPWPQKLLKRFQTFDMYKKWFSGIVGIHGKPSASRRIIDWAKTQGIKLTPAIIASLPKEWKEGLPNDMGVSIPYGYPRAFTYNPNDDQLRTLYDLLEWTWGTREITFCDPMSGGGSIPFEALRIGLTVHANELNPVASVILKATLEYPARFGSSLAEDIVRYGRMWCDLVRQRLEPFFPLTNKDETIFCYVWARTVPCPVTGKPIPLSPNWWLRKKADEPIAVELIADEESDQCRFQIVRGKRACEKIRPDKGTVKRGTATSPWTGDALTNAMIKAHAKAGRMSEQLYAVAIKTSKGLTFRSPTKEEQHAYSRAAKSLRDKRMSWAASGLVPDEPLPMDTEAWTHGNTPAQYDATSFADVFSPRQLLSHLTALESLAEVQSLIAQELPEARGQAVSAYLGLAFDKCLDYNSRLIRWHSGRDVIVNTFARHDFAFKWSFGEFDASRNLLPWAVEQVRDAYLGISALVSSSQATLFQGATESSVQRLRITKGPAQRLSNADGSVRLITVDPPYYDNVNYAELSDFFYVWGRRSFQRLYPDFFADNLTPKDEEAVANPARFAESKKKRDLARQDYDNKMLACFREMRRVLADDGVLTVMFTHKQVAAWDSLGAALIKAGFRIDASWPVATESDKSLHQAKKNAAASTILLVCRKREDASEPVWWDDLKSRVRQAARQKASEYEQQGIKGVDLYISTFGPVLSIISESWPVLTSETDSKTGDPLPLKPGDALDLAREEVIDLRKRGLLLGRSVVFDPVTDWYLLAWDAFRAQQFPADEARRLAIALGLDIEEDLVRDKRIVTKKSASVVLCLPGDRRKKNMVDPDVKSFPHLIDALHTAMMIYDEEGSKACQVFVDRQGLRTDSRTKALVQAMMEAIPTTRDKAGKFLRPEMTTLDALRMLFWDDLPAPKEEEPPKLDPQMKLAGFDDDDVEDEEDEVEDEE